jgi:phospho-N-acetylmuramoyl-pentapeptide-transferase
MLYTFLYPLVTEASFLNVLRYPSFRIVMAAMTALILTLFLFPAFIRRLQIFKFGQEVRKEGPESHYKKKGTPTMGGTLILLAVFVSTVLWTDVTHKGVWLVLLVTMGYGAIGFYDDYKKIKYKNTDGLAGRWKLLWQFIIGGVALGLYAMGQGTIAPDTSISLPFVSITTFNPTLIPYVYYPLALVLVLVGTSNAVNLTDGLDGLAIGPVMINAGTYLVLAYLAGLTVFGYDVARYLDIPALHSASELAVFCGAMVGAGMGFLWYNTYPAQVFMGDVGALALGGGLGMLAVLTKNEVLSLLLGGIFVVEAVSVLGQIFAFKVFGRRIFLMAPIHHHFEKKGWAEPKVIVRFWIISVMLAIASLSTLKLR